MVDTYNKGEVVLHIHISYSAEMVPETVRPSLLKYWKRMILHPSQTN